MAANLMTLIPMLTVADLPRTIAFYRDVLGFTVVNSIGTPEPVWCMLKRDSVSFMFNASSDLTDEALPKSAKDFQIYYIYPKDVRALHAELRSKGVVVTDLRVTSYGMREFELRDPDQYWLWFGEDTKDPPTATS